VFVDTLNDPHEIAVACSRGVHGVISDYPRAHGHLSATAARREQINCRSPPTAAVAKIWQPSQARTLPRLEIQPEVFSNANSILSEFSWL